MKNRFAIAGGEERLREDPRGSLAGFSLLELLVVVAILAILATFAVSSIQSPKSSAQLDGAARQWADEIRLARQLAMARGSLVEVRFVYLNEPEPGWNGLQIWSASMETNTTNRTGHQPERRLLRLPEGVALSTNSAVSALLGNLALSGNTNFAGGASAWRGFTFSPDGEASDLPATNSFLTLTPRREATNSSPSNFATLVIQPRLGTVTVHRP